MKIQRLLLENFRCFDSISIDFRPEFNIFIGDNAAGKTALLEALSLALSGWVGNLTKSGARDFDTYDIRKYSQWHAGIFSSEPQFPAEVTVIGDVFDSGFSWSKIIRETGERVIDDRSESLRHQIVFASQKFGGSENMPLPLLVSYRTDRLVNDLPVKPHASAFVQQADMARVEGYRDALSGGRISIQAIVMWLEYQDWIAYKQRSESPLYIAVREAMTAMIPEAKETLYDPRISEPVTVFEDGSSHPFSELSEGQRCMAALAGDIAIRMARLNPHLGENVLRETSGVVLIDELDLHLHPKWQREIVSRLRQTFPMIQFITTTHSPQILSEIEPECVSVISRDERGHIQITKPVQSYGLDANTILENLMGADARPDSVRERIDAVDEALEEGEWEKARSLVDELRTLLHGDDPETARLDASTYALEALADAVD